MNTIANKIALPTVRSTLLKAGEGLPAADFKQLTQTLMEHAPLTLGQKKDLQKLGVSFQQQLVSLGSLQSELSKSPKTDKSDLAAVSTLLHQLYAAGRNASGATLPATDHVASLLQRSFFGTPDKVLALADTVVAGLPAQVKLLGEMPRPNKAGLLMNLDGPVAKQQAWISKSDLLQKSIKSTKDALAEIKRPDTPFQLTADQNAKLEALQDIIKQQEQALLSQKSHFGG